MTTPHYIPLSAAEDDTAIVRRCLRKFARQLQQQGEIPPEVPQTEINAEVEKHVPQILQALHRSALYPHLKQNSTHLEQHIMYLVSMIGPAPVPAVAADQSFYINTMTGEALTPTWKHHNCGGTVYPTSGSTFACSVCKKAGELGVSVPEGMSRQEQMQYLLTDVEEVDLI